MQAQILPAGPRSITSIVSALEGNKIRCLPPLTERLAVAALPGVLTNRPSRPAGGLQEPPRLAPTSHRLKAADSPFHTEERNRHHSTWSDEYHLPLLNAAAKSGVAELLETTTRKH